METWTLGVTQKKNWSQVDKVTFFLINMRKLLVSFQKNWGKLTKSRFFFINMRKLLVNVQEHLNIDEQEFEHLFQQLNELKDKVHDSIVFVNYLIKSF
jgi:hypothetical protein